MLKTNLQFFAEPAADTTTADTTTTETDTDTTTAADQAKETTSTETDTKAEAQKIADAMVAKKLKGMPTKEELKAYKEWQEAQKTAEQKINEKVTAAEKAKLDAEAETNALKATVACLKQGVVADSVDDVVTLAQKLVTEEITIDDAIKQVLKKYPQFGAGEEEKGGVKPKIVTSGNPKGGNNDPSDPFAAKLAKYK